MEERRRNEEQFLRQQREFEMQRNQPYNFASQGSYDMYGANAQNSMGVHKQSSLMAQQNSYGQGNISQANTYGQSTISQPNNANFNQTSQSLSFEPHNFQANSNRPPVVSDGGCCCNIM
jgi:hypothetical protein